MSTPEPRDYCPRCGVAYEPLQEYCLECGERLPVNRGVVGVLASAWQRRFSRYPGDWIWPVLLFFVITVVATGAVLAANGSRSGTRAVPSVMPSTVPLGPGRSPGTVPRISTATVPNAPSVTITTGPIPTAPGSGKPGTTRTPPARNPNALAVWPAAKSGFTIVLESLPVAGGRAAAVARARRAVQSGLRDVGVLVSARYSSLHPGYYVVFSGIYGSQGDATAGLSGAHAKGFPDAYQTRVTK